ncbi:MAG: hypothetical protein ACD_79C01370G0004, partial [uncultured bacterium]
MIELKNISRTFAGKYRVLDNISMKIDEGEAIAILGPSGSGKTTLLDIIGTLLTPSEGSYIFNGTNIALMSEKKISEIRNTNFGFIFQSFNIIRTWSVYKNMELPFKYNPIKVSDKKTRIINALTGVSMEDKFNQKSRVLSTGEQQRVAIARALVLEPKIILADEPTGNLDSENGKIVINLLFDIWKKGKTIIVIT